MRGERKKREALLHSGSPSSAAPSLLSWRAGEKKRRGEGKRESPPRAPLFSPLGKGKGERGPAYQKMNSEQRINRLLEGGKEGGLLTVRELSYEREEKEGKNTVQALVHFLRPAWRKGGQRRPGAQKE